jgi:hypothetical protein
MYMYVHYLRLFSYNSIRLKGEGYPRENLYKQHIYGFQGDRTRFSSEII